MHFGCLPNCGELFANSAFMYITDVHSVENDAKNRYVDVSAWQAKWQHHSTVNYYSN